MLNVVKFTPQREASPSSIKTSCSLTLGSEVYIKENAPSFFTEISHPYSWTAERLLFGGPDLNSRIKFEPRTLL